MERVEWWCCIVCRYVAEFCFWIDGYNSLADTGTHTHLTRARLADGSQTVVVFRSVCKDAASNGRRTSRLVAALLFSHFLVLSVRFPLHTRFSDGHNHHFSGALNLARQW